MNKKDEDLYIVLIRYGRENLETGVSFDETIEFLKTKGAEFSKAHLRRIFPAAFLKPSDSPGSPSDCDPIPEHGESVKRFLRIQSYFHLLEYEELQEARQQAKSARSLAITAIFISAFLALASIGFSYYQVTHPQDVIIKNNPEVIVKDHEGEKQ